MRALVAMIVVMIVLALAAVLGHTSALKAHDKAQAPAGIFYTSNADPIAVKWPVTDTDRAALRGIEADYLRMVEAVAAIVTDDRSPRKDEQGNPIPGLRTRLIQYVADATRAQDRVRDEVLAGIRERGHVAPGTPLVLASDGVSWTTTTTR